ncbi:MAG: Xaa-Pro peptidase family protein [Gammaproteobacteria bacterium]|nr:Xaa-Pro peptidase family protein [Gammaproteobacteria bacterium]MCY4274796.1 Xaa-Pro peptidase family protein [Gammaproteobacteria bacterium]
MSLHFENSELAQRRIKVIAELQKKKLDGLLIFKQESMYYLTGYDTFGFCFFQCLYLGVDGQYFLLTRAPDLRQAQYTSDIKDIRIWVDAEQANPFLDLRNVLSDYGVSGKTLGCEYNAYGLSAAYGKSLDQVLSKFCQLKDESSLIGVIRAVKSDAEIVFVKRAAELADDAMTAAIETAGAGVFEGDILAAMQSAVFRGGGDYPGNEFIIGSGAGGLLCRYFSGRRTLDKQDQLTLEYAGAYRRYHACLMQTFLIGDVSNEHKNMHTACSEAMEACLDSIRPGETMGTVFSEHARVLDEHGYQEHRMNACGYSLGAMFSPIWMDYPMFYSDNPYIMQTNNVLFVHIILMNSQSGNSMTLGQTVRVTNDGFERLSRHSTELVVV